MKQTVGLVFQLAWMSLLLGILFAYAMFEGGFTSWFLLDSFVPIFVYLLCLQFYPLKGWKVNRTLSHYKVHAGDHLRVVITMRRKLRFPLYYCVIEEIMPESLNRLDIRRKKYTFLDAPEQLAAQRRVKKLIFPWFKKEMTVSYELVQIPRGRHEFTAIHVRTGDIFGFMKKQHLYQLTDELIAYPARPAVRLRESMKYQKQGSLASSAMHFQAGNVATSIREYVPGDKFSWIDWKQTAKKNDVMTKEFEKDKSTDVLVVLDACNRGKQNWLQFDAAAELSAALLEAFEKKSSKATFLSVHDKVEHFSIAEGRRAQLDRVYQHLAAVEPVPALFPAVLLQELNKMPTGFVAYILTASLDEMLFDVLRKMNMHSHGIHILLISAAAELADSDRMLVRHMAKQGITVTSLTKKQLAADPIEVNVF